jgi:ATP-dependent Lon protease
MVSIFTDITSSDLDRKAHEIFGDQVVVKSLANQAAFHRLPRYVSEYMIAKYVKPESWQDDLAKVQAKIKDLLPELDHRELVKDRLLRTGEIIVIDNVEARVDLRSGQRWARVPAINDERVRVSAALLEQNPGLLLGGLWGTTRIKYSPEIDNTAPNELIAFTPFQVGPPVWPRIASAGDNSPPTSGWVSYSRAPATRPRLFPTAANACCSWPGSSL